jgi:hypothetical protein
MSTPLSQAHNRAPRHTWAAVERARLTVVPRRSQKAPRVPFVSLVSLLLVGGVVGLLLFNTNMQQSSFVTTSMEEKAAVLAGKEESLRMQLDRLRDPQHIAARAKRLGMVPAGTPAFIRLSDGKVLGRPTPAVPTDAMRITPLPPVKPLSLRPPQVIADAAPHGRAAQHRQDAGHGGDTARGRGSASHDRGARSRTKNVSTSTDDEQSTGRTR